MNEPVIDVRPQDDAARRLWERIAELAEEFGIVEILGPDGLRRPPRTLGKYETIGIPGGSQALKRTETVTITVDGGSARRIRRPTLLGAILLKARALQLHKRTEDQRQDLILLLSFVENPRLMASELRGGERRWLQDARGTLRLDDPLLQDRFSEEQIRLARLALEILAPER